MIVKLETMIRKKEFPILIQGPPGYNKLKATKLYLDKLGYKYTCVDMLDVKLLYKPLSKGMTIAYNSCDSNVLEKLTFTEGVIIVSDVFLNIKQTLVHIINVPTEIKLVKHSGLEKFTRELIEEESKLTLFRFLGKIFNRKCEGKNLELKEDGIAYLFSNLTKTQSKEENADKENEGLTDATLTDTFESDEIITDGFKGRRIIDCSTDTFEDIKTMSEDSLDGLNLHTPIDTFDPHYIYKTFSSAVIRDTIYANFLDFCDKSTLGEFYDIISRCDTSPEQLVTLCIYASHKSRRQKAYTKFKKFSGNKKM